MARLTDGLKGFIDREPVYVLMVLFIIFINLITGYYNAASRGAEEKKISKAQTIIQDKDRLAKALAEDREAAATLGIVSLSIALFIILGLVLDFTVLIAKAQKREPLVRSHSPPPANWSVWDAAKVVIIFLFCGYALVIAEAFLLPVLPFLKKEEAAVSALNTTIMDLIALGAVLHFAIRRYRQKITDLGLTLKNLARNISYGFLGYISFLPALLLTFMITAWFVSVFKFKPQPQPVMELFMEEKKTSVLLYLSLFVAVVGPVMEEIFFRGFLYSAIKKETNVLWAVLISAFLFSVLHVHAVGFLPIFLMGAFLAYLYEKTGSLAPSATLHILHNLIMVFFIFFLKGVNV